MSFNREFQLVYLVFVFVLTFSTTWLYMKNGDLEDQIRILKSDNRELKRIYCDE